MTRRGERREVRSSGGEEEGKEEKEEGKEEKKEYTKLVGILELEDEITASAIRYNGI